MEAVSQLAPWELAEAWDNVGLLLGHPDRLVDRVLVALDATQGVVDEAVALRAQLIVTHHPILFHARKHLREDDAEGALLSRLVREGLSLIAAHTNLDNAPGGVADALAAALGLSEIQPLSCGLRVGMLPEMPLGQLAGRVGRQLGDAVRQYGPSDALVRRVAVCGGSGGSFWREALEAGAECLVTGEAGYHHALEALESGLTVLEAGHYATEHIILNSLAQGLQTKLNALEYPISIYESSYNPLRASRGERLY